MPRCLDALVVARLRRWLVEPVRERFVDDLVNERRLPRAGHTVTQTILSDGELDVDVLEVVLRRAANEERAAVVLAPVGIAIVRARRGIVPSPIAIALDLRRRAFTDNLAAVQAGRLPMSTSQSRDASSPRRARRL